MAKKNTGEKETSQEARSITLAEPTETPDYEPSNFLEEIEDKYGSVAGWLNITLYRKNQQGEKLFLKKYETPPDMDDVQSLYGGGDYVLYLKWRDADNKRLLVTKAFKIEGPSVMPSAQQAAPPGNGYSNPNEDPEEKILRKMKLYKELLGSGHQPAQSDSTIIVAGMNKTAEMMMETAKMMHEKPDDGFSKAIIELALGKAQETDLDKMTKTIEAVNKIKGSGGESDMTTELIKAGIENLPSILQMVTGPKTGPAAGLAGAGGGQIMGFFKTLAENIDKNFKTLHAEIKTMKTDIKELQDDLWEDEAAEGPGGLIDINSPGENNTENKTELTAEEKEQGLKQGAWLKTLPMADKAAQLRGYLETYSVPVVYKWCIDNTAVHTLEEFNEILIEVNKLRQAEGSEPYILHAEIK